MQYINQVQNKGFFIQYLYLKVTSCIVMDGFRQWDNDLFLKSLCISLEQKGVGDLTVNLNQSTGANLNDATTLLTLVYNLGLDNKKERYFKKIDFLTPIILSKNYLNYISIDITNNQSYNLTIQGNFFYGN